MTALLRPSERQSMPTTCGARDEQNPLGLRLDIRRDPARALAHKAQVFFPVVAEQDGLAGGHPSRHPSNDVTQIGPSHSRCRVLVRPLLVEHGNPVVVHVGQPEFNAGLGLVIRMIHPPNEALDGLHGQELLHERAVHRKQFFSFVAHPPSTPSFVC